MQGAFYRPAESFLLSQTDGEAKVSDLDLALRVAQYVVRLDVPVQNVLPVHFMQAKGDLVQHVFAELLRVVASLIRDDFGETAAVHQLEKGVDGTVPDENLHALEYLIALEGREDAELIEEFFSLRSRLWSHVFEREKLLIGNSLRLENARLASLAQLADKAILRSWVALMHFEVDVHEALDFLGGPQPILNI